MNIDVIKPLNRLHLGPGPRITALHYSHNKLYVGFSNGDLAIYFTRFNDQGNQQVKTPKTLQSYSSFNDIKATFNDNDQSESFVLDTKFKNITENGYSIDSIAFLPLTNDDNKTILAIGSGGVLRIIERVRSRVLSIMIFEDAASFSSYEYVHEYGKLVIAAKKKVFVYNVVQKSRNIINFEKFTEISLKDKIKAIKTIPNGHLLIALIYDFVVLELDTFRLKPLPVDDSSIYSFNNSTSFSYFGLSYSGPQTTIINTLPKETLLIKDTQVVTLISHDSSCSIKQTPVKLPVNPIHSAFLNPLYLLVVFNKSIEIIDISSGDLIQKFNHNIKSNSIFTTIGGNNVIIGSGTDILQFEVLDYQNQIHQYLSIRGAGSVGKSAKDPKNDLRLIGLEKAISLISKLDEDDVFFKDANGEASAAPGNSKKKKLLFIRKFYISKAIILFESYSKYHESLVDISLEWLISFQEILALFPDFLHGGNVGSDDNQPNYKADDTATIKSGEFESVRVSSSNAVKRISIADLENAKYNPNTTDSGTENTLTAITSTDSHRHKRSGASSPTSIQQENSRRYSHHSMVSPQVQVQNQLQSPQSQLYPHGGSQYSKSQNMRKFHKAVNNLIIYLTDQRRVHASFLNGRDLDWKEIKITAQDIYPYVSQDQQTRKLQLRDISSVIDTSLFLCYFYTKPMLLGPLLRLPNNQCNAKVVNQCLLANLHKHNDNSQIFIKELLDFYFGRKLHQDALEMLYKLAHDTTVYDHENTFDKFIGGADLTIQYLTKLGNDHLELVFKYAYWVITEEEDERAKLGHGELIFMNDSYECESYNNFKVLDFFMSVIKHDELAIRYLEWLLYESDVLESDGGNKQKSSTLKFSTRLCLLYLKKLKETSEANSGWYNKLYKLLGTSNQYEPWTVLKNIPTNEDRFLRLTIFIYKKLGEHDKSIDVLFNQLDDLDAAMSYCSEIYYQPHNKTTGENLLHKLLEDLLMHYDENMHKIEQLLIQQGNKMSILRILTTLPDSFPVRRLSIFLTSNLRNAQESLHDSRIASHLYKVGSLKTRHKLLTSQSEGYSIQSGKQVCGICNKKLGYTILSVDKNNQVVHYACFQKERAGGDQRRA